MRKKMQNKTTKQNNPEQFQVGSLMKIKTQKKAIQSDKVMQNEYYSKDQIK